MATNTRNGARCHIKSLIRTYKHTNMEREFYIGEKKRQEYLDFTHKHLEMEWQPKEG